MANVFAQFDNEDAGGQQQNVFAQFDGDRISNPELNVEVEQPKPLGDPQLADLAKSFLAGVERAGIGLVGLPGTVGSFMRSAAGIEGERFTGLTPTAEQVSGAVEGAAGPIYEPQTTGGEYARAIGEFVPNALAPGGAAAKAAGVILPALASEAAGQATEGTALEPYARVAGAVTGGISPSIARKVATPLAIPAERQFAVRALKAEGVTPTAGQASGSNSLRYAESELGGGATAAALERQKNDFTRAVLRRVGESADRATPEVMDRAFKRIGREFDRIAAGNQVVGDPQLTRALTDVVDEYKNLVGPASRAPVVENTAKYIAQRIGSGPIYGKNYQSITSRLARQARGTKDPELQDALYGLREALDDAFERTLMKTGNTADVEALKSARRQYKNMLVVEKAAVGGGEDAAMGAISPARLRMADVGQNRRQFVRGKSDFSDLARSGQAVMSPMPQSGTGPRSFFRNVLPALAGAAVGGASSGGVGAAVGAAVGPALSGRVLMSAPVQAYLKNQAFPGGGSTSRALLGRSGVNALLASPPKP